MLKRTVFVAVAAWVAVVVAPGVRAQSPGDTHNDSFHRVGVMNKASIVMLAEAGIVPRPLAADIATGIDKVLEMESRPGSQRSGDYLRFEATLVDVAGPDASRLHTGRSRQDMGSTSARMTERDALLETYEALLAPRKALVDLAGQHVRTIIPAYTHGVQAQPTSLAHYLLAFAASMERDASRFEEAYVRVNQSPFGVAALGTSGFAVDRQRLADLLGFSGMVENSYDANHISPVDSKTEVAGILATTAIHIGQHVQDIHTQYHQPVPWITIKVGPLTGISSIMPQKRNPSALERLRGLASDIIGESHSVFITAHNTTTGMSDYRGAQQLLEASSQSRRLYDLYARTLSSLVIDVDRSLGEVDADYSTMTEVADTLLRLADIPFRIGHHYASEITTYGREHGKRPKELTEEELRQIYRESHNDEELPVPIQAIRDALDPMAMVMSRAGIGGPQASEITRMLAERRQRLATDEAWVRSRKADVQHARTSLETAFVQLKSAAGRTP